MLISSLPQEIQEIIFQRQIEQGNTPNNKLSLDNDRRQCNFNFDQTQEGHYFWSQIDRGNIEYFYTLYHKPLELNYEIY